MSRKKIKNKVRVGSTSQKKNLAASLQKATEQVESLGDLRGQLVKAVAESVKLVQMNQELARENERLNKEVSLVLEEHENRLVKLEERAGVFSKNPDQETK